MIKFIELNGEFEFKWEYQYEECSRRIYDGERTTFTITKYQSVKLKGVELVEWLQIYGLTPDEMFKGTNIIHPYTPTIEIVNDHYNLYLAANKWKKENEEIIKNNPWTVIAMNGGYVLLSNGSKENTVELGSASIVNLEMNNSNTNTIKNNPNISVSAQASLI